MKYGWIPDRPDHRDKKFSALLRAYHPLPERVNLESLCPEVYDQGQLGSCTANAIGAMFQFVCMQEGLRIFFPSRLFLYYQERKIEGTVFYDAGAMIRTGMKVIAATGICSEDLWEYDPEPAERNVRFAVEPNPECYTQAEKHQSLQYFRLNNANLEELRSCLAEGYPFVFGFAVCESFETHEVAQSGVMPYPGPEEKVLGGHAVMAVGYDNAKGTFRIRNSWGTGWGQAGYFEMPLAALRDIADDFWTLRTVELP